MNNLGNSNILQRKRFASLKGLKVVVETESQGVRAVSQEQQDQAALKRKQTSDIVSLVSKNDTKDTTFVIKSKDNINLKKSKPGSQRRLSFVMGSPTSPTGELHRFNVSKHQSISQSSAEYEQRALLRKLQFQEKMVEKKSMQKKFMDELQDRRQTFSKFSFKSLEKDDNPYISPLLQKVNGFDVKGSMYVIDVWEDRALKKFLNYSKLNEGKYMLRGIAQQINQEQKQSKRDQPTIFTKKDENILNGRLQDKDQINHFLKHINDDFNKTEMLLDRKMNKNGLDQVAQQRMSFSNSPQAAEEYTDQLSDPTKPFNGVKFLKDFYTNSSMIHGESHHQQTPNLTNQPSTELDNMTISAFPTEQRLHNSTLDLTQSDLNTVKQVSSKKSSFFANPLIPLAGRQSSTLNQQLQKTNLNSPMQTNRSMNFLSNSDKRKSINAISNSQSKNVSPKSVFDKKETMETLQNEIFSRKPSMNNDMLRRPSVDLKQLKQIDILERNNHNLKTEKPLLPFAIGQRKPSGNFFEEAGTNEIATPTSSQRNGVIPNKKKINFHFEKMNSMLREMEIMQSQEFNSKKRIDDLLDRMQERVIKYEENQRKKSIDVFSGYKM